MIYAVIMAGGKGTRFWPLSRSVKAKQFLNVIGETSLLHQTVLRLSPLVSAEHIWVVGSDSQAALLTEHKNGVPDDQLLFEPAMKNTAACIGWAAFKLIEKDPDAIMVVLPSDHIIKESAKFRIIIKKAIQLVQSQNCLVTIGVQPTEAHTGYGYIEAEGAPIDDVYKVSAFHEKPDAEKARIFVESGRYFWNAGMFVWKAKKIIDLIHLYMPEHYRILSDIAKIKPGRTYDSHLKTLYEQFTPISIDYGIMEKAFRETMVIKADFTWSDIGSWTALETFWERDRNQNAHRGELMALDSRRNVVYSDKRLVALIDVNDLVVVDTDDALLILPKSSDQKIRELVKNLPEQYQ